MCSVFFIQNVLKAAQANVCQQAVSTIQRLSNGIIFYKLGQTYVILVVGPFILSTRYLGGCRIVKKENLLTHIPLGRQLKHER